MAVGAKGGVRRRRSPGGCPTALLVMLALIALPACHRHRRPGQGDHTIIYTNDPTTASRLLGFHDIENRAWRWSGKQFAVRVHNPDYAESHGAMAVMHFTIPPSQINALGPITVRGDAAGIQLPPKTYSAPGAYVYRAELPPSVFEDGDVTVSFTLDKALPPSAQDQRTLGIVVESVGFERKDERK